MRIRNVLLVAAATLVALPASTNARALPQALQAFGRRVVLAGRAPIEFVIPKFVPEDKPIPPKISPVSGGAGSAGGASNGKDGPAHLSIPESGFPKPTASQDASILPTSDPVVTNAPAATQAKSIAPSATEPNPVAPSAPPQGSVGKNPTTQCKRGAIGVRCASSEFSGSSEPIGQPIGLPAREQPESGSWYEFVNVPGKVQTSRTKLNQRINNRDEFDVPTSPLTTSYTLTSDDASTEALVDTEAAGIGSILSALKRRGEIANGEGAKRANIRALNHPVEGNERVDVQDTSFTADGKMIIANFAKAANDLTPAGSGKMSWDQLVFLQYQQFKPAHLALHKLQFIGQSQINNRATLQTMLDVFGGRGLSSASDMDKIISIRSVQDGAVPGSVEAQAFDALSWTDNVNGAYWLLSDFHDALGDKRISQFHLRFNNVDQKNADELEKDIEAGTRDDLADILIELK